MSIIFSDLLYPSYFCAGKEILFFNDELHLCFLRISNNTYRQQILLNNVLKIILSDGSRHETKIIKRYEEMKLKRIISK